MLPENGHSSAATSAIREAVGLSPGGGAVRRISKKSYAHTGSTMHSGKIGDSLDLAKRHILSLLRQLKRPTLVAPLSPEVDFDLELYKRVLDVNRPHMVVDVRAGCFRRPRRGVYLAAVRAQLKAIGSSTLLLDPSSGINQEREPSARHISCAEVRSTCRGVDLWLIYHHQSTGHLTYCQAAQLVKARYFYNFGKAAVIIGGRAKAIGDLTRELAASLASSRLQSVRLCA